ncbi:MAG: sulfatase [Prolixibacteraceae bacterium]|nr:sulfatase [Prolixibacteraceae bacterium]MBT6767048.1 sulfatase [Prolixibacteraceae bacterium]MBT6998820.1 sulfatase [Prolixibacteraceae bacterium]MBT7396788.1 sulfatase [Prolixibacteraceae bacterium]
MIFKLKNTFLLIFTIILIGSCSVQNKKQVPNFVFILADDLGYSQVGCYGSTYYQTPNLDKLAEQGMRFTNAYAACPVCSPTRASIMTGKYPARLHLTDFIAGNNKDTYPLSQPDWQKFLPLEEVTFAEILKESGYNTALFGKWHLSKEKMPPGSFPYNPDKQGFDESFVTYKPSGGMTQPWQDAEIDAHNVDTITNLAINFLERNKSNPFFLFVSHNTIHDPLKEKAETIQKYENQKASDEPENHPIVAAMIERLDNSCGTIIDKINELGLDKNTVVIFFGDNGGRDKYAKQTPFRAGKGWLYEGGIREPLIIKWKDKVSPGTISEALISSVDFLPTFLEMAGGNKTPENIDGKSFLPVLENNQVENHNSLFWHYPHYHGGSGMIPAGAVRSGKYKLIEWYEPKLLNTGNSVELFDLNEDQGETINLSEQLPEKAAELREMLNNWRIEVDAQMPTINKNATPN